MAGALARVVGGFAGAVLGGVVSMILVTFEVGGGWLLAPVGIGFVVGLLGGDQGLYALMRVVGRM